MMSTSTGGSRFRVALAGLAVALALTASIIPVAAQEHKKVPLPSPNTNVQTYTQAGTRSVGGTFISPAITSGSNGQTLPQSTINVANPAGYFATGGTNYAWIDMGSAQAVVSYTGASSTQLTGCVVVESTGTLTMSTGNLVSQAYQAGSLRRLALVSLSTDVSQAGAVAYVIGLTTLGGAMKKGAGWAGVELHNGTTDLQQYHNLSIPVDPASYYGVEGSVSGSASTLSPVSWVDVDL